jgi:poly-gamma-glutamate capsule biosynthesis protein CapA/YwtB (metallophosphatase superfamily)
MNSISILIGGDLAPTQSNYSFFGEGNLKAIIDSNLINLLDAADYRIFNLEVPITDTEKPIKKDGPNLISPAQSINGLKALNPSVIGLANNHIMDQDDQGLFNTMELLSANKISFVGAGKDLEYAKGAVILVKDGVKIGIYACAENEFSIAKENKAGANPFDPLESLDHIINLKSLCDFVIVLHHGGKEYYRYPSPDLQKVCRKMAEKGADLVVCQHTHCIGAFENYSDSTIVYGQGNFLFDRQNNEFCATGLLVKATFGAKMAIDFIPVKKNGNGVILAPPIDSESILKEFNERSRQIALPGFIEAEYEKFCVTKGVYYLGISAGFGRVLSKIDRMLNGLITKRIYSLKKLNRLQNFLECEAHRELFLRYINLERNKK